MLNILSHKNVNLHSASSEGGLIHFEAGRSKVVPDDVKAHPGFEILLRAGDIVVISGTEPDKPTEVSAQRNAEANADITAQNIGRVKPDKNVQQLAE